MYPYFTSIPVLFAMLLYFVLAFKVGRARQKYSIKAPAITGHEMFERAYRVQMNMLEQLIMFLPCLGLFSWYTSDRGAFCLGMVWVLARTMYSRSYMRDPDKRHLWFLIAILVVIVLWVGAFSSIIRSIFLARF